MATNFMELMMQNPDGMQVINDQGILSMAMPDPATGGLVFKDGKQVNQVNPGAVMKTANDGQTTLMAPNFPNQMADNQNRKKASLFDKFRSLPPDVLMRAGGAMLGAKDFTSGMQAAGNQYADFFKTQTPQAKLDRALDIMQKVENINKTNQKSIKAQEDKVMMVGDLQQKFSQYGDALKLLEVNPDSVGLSFNPATIIRDWLNFDIDAIRGDPKAQIRAKLQTLKIDETLLKTARTKGAISNTEMAIFMSDQPKFSYAKDYWNGWLVDRQKALGEVIRRLETGETVPLDQRPTDEDYAKLFKSEDTWLGGLTDTLGGMFSGGSNQATESMNEADKFID